MEGGDPAFILLIITVTTITVTTLTTVSPECMRKGIEQEATISPHADRKPQKYYHWYQLMSSQRRIQWEPPIEQSLVREGFFAIKLAEALKVGPVKSEGETESVLASVGIAPQLFRRR